MGDLLRLDTLALLRLPVVAREPERAEEEEADARADRAGVVGPRGAEEARVAIVPRGDDRDDCRAVPESPSLCAQHQHQR